MDAWLALWEAEEDVDKTLRGSIYLIALLYMFVRVNVISDFFMTSIHR